MRTCGSDLADCAERIVVALLSAVIKVDGSDGQTENETCWPGMIDTSLVDNLRTPGLA
jgi:hypothetical protein